MSRRRTFGGRLGSGVAPWVYAWVRSDKTTATRTLNFHGGGVQGVSYDWTVSRSFTGWIELRVQAPNKLVSRPASFRANCGP